MIASKEVDLLNGPITSKIIRFAIPVLCTNILQTLFNSADMAVVGLSGVDGAIGAIGTTLAYIGVIINLFMGLSVGAGIVIARTVGEGNKEKQGTAVHTALLTALFFGFLCSVIGLCTSKKVLIFLGDEGHILDLALLYTKIYFLCVPCIALSNFLMATFRAKGDSTTPLIAMAGSGLLNVVLNLFFVLICKMSVDGVAIATAIANLAAAVFLLIVLSHDDGPCRFEFSKLKIDRKALKEILVTGLPSAIQGSLFCIANMQVQSSIIALNNIISPGGSAVLDGNAAAQNIDSFACTAAGAFTASTITNVSQHKGALKYDRLKQVIKKSYLLIFCLNTILPLSLYLFRVPLIKLYVRDQAAIQIAIQRCTVMLLTYYFQGFMDVGSGVVRGLGKSLTSTGISLFFMCIFRTFWIQFLFPKFMTYNFVMITYPITWFLTGLGQLIVVILTMNKVAKQK